MKICGYCDAELPLSSFSPQRTNPAKLYKWCDGCRTVVNKTKTRVNLQSMAAKSRERRSLTPEQVDLAKQRRKSGLTLKQVGEELNVSPMVIHKVTTRGYR
jgi:hypothetical protein